MDELSETMYLLVSFRSWKIFMCIKTSQSESIFFFCFVSVVTCFLKWNILLERLSTGGSTGQREVWANQLVNHVSFCS